MAGPRIVVVVNPRSQAGALGRKWSHIAAQLRRELGAFEDALTRGPGDATRLAREAIDAGADVVVAIGGDGTINEVANGFFDGGRPVATEAALGILPFGTGGDFRKTIHIPKDIAMAARILRRGNRQTIDVGRLDYTGGDGGSATRMFVNIASFGISGLVDQYVNEGPTKLLGGLASFAIATVRASLSYQNQRVQLVFDGDSATATEHTINTVAVCNGRYFGGGMHIAPDAQLDDGAFDVVVIGDLTARDMVRDGYRLYTGTHLSLTKVHHRRARRVDARPLGTEPVRLDVDGETPGRLPATFEVVPRALRVIAP
ncbi:MAG: diacylglycerol kinase family lipid kinase [Deltaproteobacteria bacterium]|nr:MAG: diacylglycerol kinase family lipid kinase [Deltaproteobacteria bacterium]